MKLHTKEEQEEIADTGRFDQMLCLFDEHPVIIHIRNGTVLNGAMFDPGEDTVLLATRDTVAIIKKSDICAIEARLTHCSMCRERLKAGDASFVAGYGIVCKTCGTKASDTNPLSKWSMDILFRDFDKWMVPDSAVTS